MSDYMLAIAVVAFALIVGLVIGYATAWIAAAGKK